MKTDKLKYVLAFIFLLCAFWCGVNFKRWYTINHRLKLTPHQKAHSKKIKAKTYFSLSVFIVSLILSKSSIISIKKEDFMTKTL